MRPRVSSWLPAAIELDGRAASALALGDDGYLHVRLDPGLHRLQARGPIAGRQLTLDPGTPPRWVVVDAPGWEVSGLSESGKIDGSLGLVKPLPAGLNSPSLAESFTASKDFTTFTFTLRKNAKFHDGSPVTAEDVKFSFDRYKGASAKLLKDKVKDVQTPSRVRKTTPAITRATRPGAGTMRQRAHAETASVATWLSQ